MATESGDGIVQIAYLHRESVSHSWHDSMRRLRDHDQANGQRVAAKPLNIRCSSGQIVPSRNFAAKLFLDNTDHEWFMFIDTDMGFRADLVDRLLDAADPVSHPVVGALCFALMEQEYDGMGGYRMQLVPTLYRIGHTLDGHESFAFSDDYPQDTVMQVAATGAACLLMHRSALEKVRAEHGDHWFDQLYASAGHIVGEDFAFCLRLGALGIPIFVHTGVKTSHHKEVWFGEEDYLRQVATTEDDTTALPAYIHVAGSLATLGADGPLKLPADLDRYKAIIEATKPEVLVETGTGTGASARWFAAHGLGVITVDVDHHSGDPEVDESGERVGDGWVDYIVGDAADPAVAEKVATLVAGRRCMVSLDSDHSAAHVAKEIELYGPLVTPGCYLVVENGILGHAPPALRARHDLDASAGSPLDAIAEKLHDNPDWSRDIAIERMSPTSHNPAGFWLKVGVAG